MTLQPSRLLILLAFAAIYFSWGSTYLGILIAIRDIPPFLMAGCRFLCAGSILLLWCLALKHPFPSLNSVAKISFSGFLMLFFGNGAVVWVEQHLTSGLTSILVATVPLWFVLLDRHQWKFHLSNKRIVAGILIGFAGVLMLFADTETFNFSGNKIGIISFFVMISGSIIWAIGSLFTKYTSVEGSSAMKASFQMHTAGVALSSAGLITGEHHEFIIENVSMQAVIALLYLIIFGSVIAYMAYVWLLSVRPPSLVGTYALVNPGVAVFLGWLFASERISVQQIIALIIILAGVVLVNFQRLPLNPLKGFPRAVPFRECKGERRVSR